MHEIVIVRNAYYEQGAEVHSKRLIESGKERSRLWWFNVPYTEKDLGLVLKPHATNPELSVMSCEAIWFEFDFVPNLRELEHFQPGSSYMAEEFEYGKGIDLFEEDIPALVKIIRRKLKTSEYSPLHADTDFYALYDVDILRDWQAAG